MSSKKLLVKYMEDIEKDLKLDEINIKEVQMALPSKKHFWAARLIQHKIEVEQLKRDKVKMIKIIQKQIHEESAVRVSGSKAFAAASDHDDVKAIEDKIKDEYHIIEMLEKTRDIFDKMTWDIKNIIEIIKLEQL